MYYKVYFDINNFPFWSGAKDRMDDATPEQREQVEQRILDSFAYEEDRIPTDTDINDLVWFECDDIFYPDEEQEDEDVEEDYE